MGWTYGYATEVEYVNDFNHVLNPLWLDFCLTLAGVETSEALRDSAKISYLELGFGLGNSLILNALTRDGEFVGNDFMPSHAFYALKNANAANGNIKIFDDSFAKIKKRFKKEGYKFDYIILHGVWSWISKENQEIILKIIEECLNIGGVVFISYNCYPGWEGKTPIRHLAKLYESKANGKQSDRIKQSLDFSKRLFEAGAAFIDSNPLSLEIEKELQTRTINYLSHEFFNKDWHCCYFSDIAACMKEVKLDFAGSAKLTWHFDSLTFSDKQKALLQSISDSILQEQLKDYFINESFRMDIFTKGNRKLTQKERLERLLETSFVLIKPPKFFQAPESSEIQNICRAILDFFTQDYRPKILRELVESLNIEAEVALPIICAMMTQGILHPSLPVTSEIYEKVKAYNKHLFAMNNRAFLACAIIGGGVYLDEITWTCLKGFFMGFREQESLIDFVFNELNLRSKELLQVAIKDFLSNTSLYKMLGILY